MRRKPLAAPVNAYHATLRRVPDEIMLAVAAQDFNGNDGARCLCGWVVREYAGRLREIDPVQAGVRDVDGRPAWESDEVAASVFGGTDAEWGEIYNAAGDEAVDATNFGELELAFTLRVMEAAGVA